MDENQQRYHELNLASKAIIERIQELALEKAKLEAAIKIQKDNEAGAL